MGKCIITQLPGRSADEYQSWFKEISPEGLPKGVATQVVGSSPEGVTVVTIWDTDEAAQFAQTRVKPALEKLGVKANVSILNVERHYQRG